MTFLPPGVGAAAGWQWAGGRRLLLEHWPEVTSAPEGVCRPDVASVGALVSADTSHERPGKGHVLAWGARQELRTGLEGGCERERVQAKIPEGLVSWRLACVLSTVGLSGQVGAGEGF